MAVIYPRFLSSILDVHDSIRQGVSYPFFDPACRYYEAIRAIQLDQAAIHPTLDRLGLTEAGYRKSLGAFSRFGTLGLIGLDSRHLSEDFPLEAERMVFVLKSARPWFPATKMVTLLKGFDFEFELNLMRHLYASYGWAQGTKAYEEVDFRTLNLKITKLLQLRDQTRGSVNRDGFVQEDDHLQQLLEVMRTRGHRGITKRHPMSRVTFKKHENSFLCYGLLGLVPCALPSFRESKLGFKEEGWMVFSKIQNLEKNEAHYLAKLRSKSIEVDPTSITKVFRRWRVDTFQSHFKGDLGRLVGEAEEEEPVDGWLTEKQTLGTLRLDKGFLEFYEELKLSPIALANPGVFVFLPYLNRLNLFEKLAEMLDLDPDSGYSWFSLVLLNLGRIFNGISSISKSCRIHEMSLPVSAGLVSMPCNDSLLNGLAVISEKQLLRARQALIQASFENGLIKGRRLAFDFHMRDFSNDDIELKQIGKGPSPKKKICFPGFRPHLAWDMETGVPISLEFRNGRSRAATTVKRFVREFLKDTIGYANAEHIYIDSEYTAEHVWRFFVEPETVGADLTMCVKQNPRVRKFINSFLQTNPNWVYWDDLFSYTKETFEIPIRDTAKSLRCVLKRHEVTGRLRCFGSTLSHLDAKGILKEYKIRWIIENGIKDLVGNYFFDVIPGIDPHRINIHYFIVTLARVLFEMLSRDFGNGRNPDGTQKTLGSLAP